jgi:hypothetical protein
VTRGRVILNPDGEWDRYVDSCPNADVYHHAAYAKALRSEDGSPALVVFESDLGTVVHPLLLRPLSALDPAAVNLLDARSFYGYGGPAWSCRKTAAELELLGDFWRADANLLRELGVISEFVKLHPLAQHRDFWQGAASSIVRGPTVSVCTSPDREILWRRLSKNHQRNVLKAIASGVTVEFSTDAGLVDEFVEIYTRTMDRLHARREYYFTAASFRDLFGLPSGCAWFALARMERTTIAMNLNLAGKSLYHYHLGASNERARTVGANHLLMFESILHAKTIGKEQLHMGGGYRCRLDGVLRFKRGFGGDENEFVTVERVLSPNEYAALCSKMRVSSSNAGYFPPYRGTEVETETAAACGTSAWCSIPTIPTSSPQPSAPRGEGAESSLSLDGVRVRVK